MTSAPDGPGVCGTAGTDARESGVGWAPVTMSGPFAGW